MIKDLEEAEQRIFSVSDEMLAKLETIQHRIASIEAIFNKHKQDVEYVLTHIEGRLRDLERKAA